MANRMHKWLAVTAAGVAAFMATPSVSFAQTSSSSPTTIAQGIGQNILQQANYFGDTAPDTPVTVDIVLKLQNQQQLASYINQTTTPGPNYRHYINTAQFAAKYAPSPATVNTIERYLGAYGIQTSAYANHLVITATGTAGQFNQAFRVTLQDATLDGHHFHAAKSAPTAPATIADSILCVLGLSNYTNFTSEAKPAVNLATGQPQGMTAAPSALMPSDLEQQYNVTPLYKEGAAGQGQTIGIITLANFNPSDAYTFWKYNNIAVKSSRIHVYNVDGGSGLSVSAGSDETTLDVEQSGALAPQADINVYVGPNSDTGLLDAFATAISDDAAQQISVSWGESETAIVQAVAQGVETPQYANAFNQFFMEGAAQGQSLFAAAGDTGAYAAAGDAGRYNLSVLNPADSPYITAAGGTTLPVLESAKFGVTQERAWGWDYLYPILAQMGLPEPNGFSFTGGGGGFSTYFATPSYQLGVPGVNQYTAVQWWTPSVDGSTTAFNPVPGLVTGTGSGRNLPDLSMDADPESGYSVYFSLPVRDGSNQVDTGWAQYGGTSFVAPQLAGLSALINSADRTQVGFWNPQIYRFAQLPNSPFHPLNTSGTSNDNLYYTGTPGTLYNQATGLGTPDVAALAQSFASSVDPGKSSVVRRKK